jgi:hypothetical protein
MFADASLCPVGAGNGMKGTISNRGRFRQPSRMLRRVAQKSNRIKPAIAANVMASETEESANRL